MWKYVWRVNVFIKLILLQIYMLSIYEIGVTSWAYEVKNIIWQVATESEQNMPWGLWMCCHFLPGQPPEQPQPGMILGLNPANERQPYFVTQQQPSSPDTARGRIYHIPYWLVVDESTQFVALAVLVVDTAATWRHPAHFAVAVVMPAGRAALALWLVVAPGEHGVSRAASDDGSPWTCNCLVHNGAVLEGQHWNRNQSFMTLVLFLTRALIQ